MSLRRRIPNNAVHVQHFRVHIEPALVIVIFFEKMPKVACAQYLPIGRFIVLFDNAVRMMVHLLEMITAIVLILQYTSVTVFATLLRQPNAY